MRKEKFKRLEYTPFWKLTFWGFLNPFRNFRGCDEYHNLTYSALIPLVGMFTWWRSTNEELHLCSWWFKPDGMHTSGKYVEGCIVCEELMTEIWMDDWLPWDYKTIIQDEGKTR